MEIKPNWKEVEKNFRQSVSDVKHQVQDQAARRAIRASNELRNSALRILRGERSGKVYRKPFTKKAVYTASAPGEPPAVRSGTLRRSWGIRVVGEQSGFIKKKTTITSGIYTDVPYAPILEDGGPKLAPRPYSEKIVEDAMPRIKDIYKQSYLS